MTASIMIVTYNRLELTKKAIKCILENTSYPFYLCIVDNGSTDDTADWLSNNFDDGTLRETNENCLGASIYLNNENRGIAIGRNQGLVLANRLDTPWLVTMDNDVWVPKGWLTEAIEILKENRTYASVGVNMENVKYPIVKLNGKEFQSKPQGNLGTACMVFNRTLHKMLGFFNYKDYGKYGEEDADWGMRTRVVGFKLGYIKENGKHLGEGDQDTGAYREFKTVSHKRNLAKFNANCREYARRTKPLFISFNEND
jgi:GT2 family glycosyltransferase